MGRNREEKGGSVVAIARPEAMFEVVNRQAAQPAARRQTGDCDRQLQQVASSSWSQ
jgi:hypothetical protein